LGNSVVKSLWTKALWLQVNPRATTKVLITHVSTLRGQIHSARYSINAICILFCTGRDLHATRSLVGGRQPARRRCPAQSLTSPCGLSTFFPVQSSIFLGRNARLGIQMRTQQTKCFCDFCLFALPRVLQKNICRPLKRKGVTNNTKWKQKPPTAQGKNFSNCNYARDINLLHLNQIYGIILKKVIKSKYGTSFLVDF